MIPESLSVGADRARHRSSHIRALNDTLRQTGRGGRLMLTAGVAALPATDIADIVAATASFDAFSEDNDPWGEHDCAVVDTASHRIIWKIDYYDSSMTCGSADPADDAITTRVLTIMLAEEY